MHDLDRTQLGYEANSEFEFEASEFETDEFEYADEGGAMLSEVDEYELASELLAVQTEAELDQFLGKLIRRIGRGTKMLIRSPIGKAVGGILKGVAKKALPLATSALGGIVGGPLGAQIGAGVASAAGDAVGLEFESGEQEDREFEGAKQFVRLAANTVSKVATAPPGADPRAIVQAAAVGAARKLAPGLLKQGGTPNSTSGRSQSGRWSRRGNTIILHGV